MSVLSPAMWRSTNNKMAKRIQQTTIGVKSVILAIVVHALIIAAVGVNILFQSDSNNEVISLESEPAPITATAVEEKELDREIALVREQKEIKRKEAEQRKRLLEEAKLAQQELEAKREEEQQRLAAITAQREDEERKAQQLEEQRKQADLEQQRKQAEIKRLEQEKQKQLDELAALEEQRKQADLERQRKEAEIKRLEKEKREREEAERQKLAEEKRKKEEAEKKRLAEEERRKQEEVEKKRLAEAQKLQTEEEERRRLAEEKLKQQQLQQRASRELAKFESQIRKKVEDNWVQTSGSRIFTASVQVVVNRQGTVLSADIAQSSGSTQFDRSVIHAIQRASPLPIPSDPELFDHIRKFNFKFTTPSA